MIFVVFISQSYLLEEVWRVVLLIDGQEGEVGGRRVPLDLLMEKINPCYLKQKILKSEAVCAYPLRLFFFILNQALSCMEACIYNGF
jgi:hypothetical protein